MSGWVGTETFDLTWTKATKWHRHCRCGAASLVEIYVRHLEPAGFARHYQPSANACRISRSNLRSLDSEWPERPIYEALQPVGAERERGVGLADAEPGVALVHGLPADTHSFADGVP